MAASVDLLFFQTYKQLSLEGIHHAKRVLSFFYLQERTQRKRFYSLNTSVQVIKLDKPLSMSMCFIPNSCVIYFLARSLCLYNCLVCLGLSKYNYTLLQCIRPKQVLIFCMFCICIILVLQQGCLKNKDQCEMCFNASTTSIYVVSDVMLFMQFLLKI